MFDKALEGLIVKQSGQSMNLENFLSFCRTTRRLGGHIISKQFKRQGSGQKWLSSFAALSFTFFSAFPGLPTQVALPALEAQSAEVAGAATIAEEPLKVTPEELCQLERDIRDIKKAHTESLQEREVPCQKNTKNLSLDTESKEDIEKQLNIEEVTEGYPIYEMAGSIASFDKSVAGLLVGIAKKESSWGEHSPSKGGQDCYNYWGYKGAGGRGASMGYACFESREEAVETVGNRLERLVEKRASSSPSQLVTSWKCGNSCAGHSKESVSKWISDVEQYYRKIALR